MNASVKQTSSLAIISLASGILGWTFLPLIASIIAIVTGHMARAEIRRNPEGLEGDGLALAGLILGYGAFALTLFLIILAVLFFGGLAVLLAWLGLAGHLG